MIDFPYVISEAYRRWVVWDEEYRGQSFHQIMLSAPVPINGEEYSIAKLLAIGVAVVTAQIEGACAVRISPEHNLAIEADRLLQFLRRVEP